MGYLISAIQLPDRCIANAFPALRLLRRDDINSYFTRAATKFLSIYYNLFSPVTTHSRPKCVPNLISFSGIGFLSLHLKYFNGKDFYLCGSLEFDENYPLSVLATVFSNPYFILCTKNSR